MADDIFSVLSSADQIAANYSKYGSLYTDSSSDIVNQETFLKLLVAEMSNQDPLEPTSNTEFVSQLAQFSSMQYMMESSQYAESNYATSLVGKIATASRTEGTQLVTKTGVVEKVRKGSDGDYLVTIDGEEFTLSSVSSVQPNDSTSSSLGNTTTSLAASIAQASMMIGMFATVKSDSSSDSVVAGLIDSIKVKNGTLYAVINSKDYELSSLTEVTYAYYDNGSSDDTNTDNSTSGSTDKVTEDDSTASDSTETVTPDVSDTDISDGSEAPDNSSDEDVQATAVGAYWEV